MFGLAFNWFITKILAKKVDEQALLNIQRTNKKIMGSSKWLSLTRIVNNNLDIKSGILSWFYFSFWFNFLFFVLSVVADIFYSVATVSDFFGYQIRGTQFNWDKIGLVIVNGLFIVSLLRLVSDCYKLSLRNQYRRGYLKLLILDVATLNVFSVMGTLKFVLSKSKFLKRNDDYQINHNNFDFQQLKNYSKIVVKLEIKILIVTLLVLFIDLICGYFVEEQNAKLLFLVISSLSFVVLYAWLGFRLISLLVIQKMFKNLSKESYSIYYLLSIVRFLLFTFGSYYLATLIIFLKVPEIEEDFLLQNL